MSREHSAGTRSLPEARASICAGVNATSPYRTATAPGRTSSGETFSSLDEDLGPVLALVWVASVARVVGAFARHEVFGAEATLALLAAVWTPRYLFSISSLWLANRRARHVASLRR
jgi:hypothetical protein